jgi:FKBP-type peptidyl-prolyl cis-trans isomerase FkpA
MKTLIPFALAAALIACGSSIEAKDKPASAPKAPASAATIEKTVTLPSGVQVTHLKEGKGASPMPTEQVKVHYRGTFPDGKEFDSSYKRGESITFGLNRVIPCWTQGVGTMKPGGKAKLVCPSATAYGERGAGGVIPPNAVLHFEVELLEVVK